MKKIIFITTLLLFTSLSFAQQSDDIGWLWVKHKNIPLDTQAHMLGGFVIGFTTTLMWKDITNDNLWGMALGNATQFALGNMKEGLDLMKGGVYDWNDIFWGNVSALVGSVIAELWSSNVTKSRKIERLEAMIAQDKLLKEPLSD